MTVAATARWIGIAALLFAAAGAAPAADYYVSPSGNDENRGTAPSAAWKTLARVNRTRFVPGDRIFLRGGVVFAGSLRFDARDAGTPARPITLSSYGTGRATIHPGNGNGIYVHNAGGFTITDLNIVGSGRTINTGDGIRFFNDLSGNVKLEHVLIERVEASGFGQRGISIGGWNGASGYRGVRVARCRLYDNVREGLILYAQAPEANELVYVADVRAHDNPGSAQLGEVSGSGIVLGSVNGARVERCVTHDNGRLGNGGVGIYAYDSTGVIFQHNESYNNRTAGNIDGGGLDLDRGTSNSIVQYNYTHNNDGAGIGVFQLGEAPSHVNNVIRYNISENDGRKNSYAGIFLAHGVRGVAVYNNTIFVSPAPSGVPAAFRAQPGTTGVTVRNNLFVTTGGLPLVLITAGPHDLRFQNNAYWSSGAAFHVDWQGAVYNSLEAWRTATGQERLGERSVGLFTDPRLTRPGLGPTLQSALLLRTLQAYRLGPTSPLINAGLDLAAEFTLLPGVRDFFGTPLPQNGRFDIGAHESATARK